MEGITVVINDQFSSFNKKRTKDVELADGIGLTAISSSRQRLQIIAEEKNLERLIAAVEIEKDVLSYAAEQYAGLDNDIIFDSLGYCIDDYEKLREKLLSLKD